MGCPQLIHSFKAFVQFLLGKDQPSAELMVARTNDLLDREDQLKEREAQVHRREAQCLDRETQLREREAHLQERQRQLGESEAQLIEGRNDLDRRTEEFKTQCQNRERHVLPLDNQQLKVHTITQDEILVKVSTKEVTPEAAVVLLKALEPSKVDVTQPRIQKDGKLCVIPKLTLTVYQLVKTVETAKELLKLAEAEMCAATTIVPKTSNVWAGKDGKSHGGDEYNQYKKGSALVGYKVEQVAYCEAFFARQAAKKAA